MYPDQPIPRLDDVIINSELQCRPARMADYEAENKALIALARTMADSPEKILQRLVETALQLCHADTAGISLLEKKDGKEVFRWEALAGVFGDRLNATMPREASPCGTTIDRNATQLMYMAERVFPALKSEPAIVEALLIPFHVKNHPVGTVWVVAHDERRKFDKEDERIVRTLAEFASAAWQLWKTRADAEAAAQKEYLRGLEVEAENKALETHIFKRTRVEHELQRLNRNLQAAITEKTAELNRVNADMIKSIEKGSDAARQLQHAENIDILVAGVAHDLNNVLNIIQAYAALIMSHPADSSNVIEDTEMIMQNIAEAAALSRSLFDGGIKSEMKFERANINDLLRRLTGVLSRMFPRSIEISLDADELIPNVRISAIHLNQAMLNLCINARDAIVDNGKVVISTQTAAGEALRQRFPEAGEDRYACISVSDTGVGMAENIKSHIFESGFTTKPPGQGAGLGLPKVQETVLNHHGVIEVISEPNRGSTFNLYLPIQKAAVLIATPPAQNNAQALGNTILFAEDETKLAELMQTYLEREGYTVLIASDGVEAVELHNRHKDEIVVAILDSGLAKLSGWEALQQMKKNNSKLKAILASGYISHEVVSLVGKGELIGVLQKPYHGKQVLDLIRHL